MSNIGYPQPAPQVPGDLFAPSASAAMAAPAHQSRARSIPIRAAALVAGPMQVTAGFALHPVGAEDGPAFARAVAAHSSRWAISHLLICAGLLTLVAALGLVHALATGRGRRLLLAGSAVLVVGAVAMALDAIAHGYLGYVMAGRHDLGPGGSAAIETAAAHSTWASAVSALAALFPLGVVGLAAGCARAGVNAVVVGLLVAGVAGVGLVGAGPLTLLGTAPLVLGFAGLAGACTARQRTR